MHQRIILLFIVFMPTISTISVNAQSDRKDGDEAVFYPVARIVDGYTFWVDDGSEKAGNILTGYLIPEILTLYTEEKKLDIIKNYRLIPDIEGNIKVFQKFWHLEDNKNIIPYLIAYADLMYTNNRRCIETAQKIYEQNLTNTIK